MTNYINNDVIDLTKSFTIIIDDSNDVIDLDDSPINYCVRKNNKRRTSKGSSNNDKVYNSEPRLKETNAKETNRKLGKCAICWDELGNNPLASTKCGHVYCMRCLEMSLKQERRCPICKCLLRGSSSYHPLYI